jgi:mycoredoxin
MIKIKMYTTTSCSDCRLAKRFLVESGIEFEEINIETVPGAAEILIRATGGKKAVPTFCIEGAFLTCSPFERKKLSEALRLSGAHD